MKVYLSFDMEGVAGIVDWAQCRPSGGAAYEVGCRLLLGEVNAAIEGAVAGGAEEIVANDAHGAMANLDPELIRAPATYLSGGHKPGYMMQALDSGFDAVFFVGYHGSICGAASVLSHTYNPAAGAGAAADPGCGRTRRPGGRVRCRADARPGHAGHPGDRPGHRGHGRGRLLGQGSRAHRHPHCDDRR